MALSRILPTDTGPTVRIKSNSTMDLAEANESELTNTVKLTGDQEIADVKTFTSSPIVPTPTTDTQASNKAYADTKLPNNITKAELNTAVSDGDVAFLNSANTFSETNIFNDKIGINESNPDTFFQVKGDSGLAAAHIQGDGEDQLTISGTLNAAAETAGIAFRYGGSLSGNKIARILAFTQSGGGGDLLFQTAADGESAWDTKMTILKGGNVGIGTTSPSYKLDVTGTFRATGTMTFAEMTVSGGYGANFQLVNTGAQKFKFKNNSGTELFTITEGGNVGIGTAIPGETLHVNGGLRLGTTANAVAGNIRWNGTKFQGYDGTAWRDFH